ncbi:glycosyltransferase family 8 protein [Elizabethkingia anophelis]|uniref:Glycosyltransferase family 8 protein n=1 Tax=Elizabethkingia anophelis R26 TaxID=1246994 RepID=A0ABM6MSU7_9FLAO|nr:glycosyltransferase family 8 protein [Elizabethkingia anophelis]ATC36149.1 glycosyltransferase family 8 protein [Elizabethkingia anophelis R26]ATC39826.1 glycosyltransferase family 8 protein [Elizabethkingia anophelis Ag1]ATC43505.1 glycosyltransferase family 8 protein [Elizabethkingia anophelis]ATC47181.1 glycosyltransferase family 8 protein [Elizabethkingia anophelis]ELR81030.1 stress protein [Elizabethkingia anophelis R26]
MNNTKNNIPIVFCFDDNLIMPAGICISSLLENAKPSTFYDIYILHNEGCKYPKSGYLERLFSQFVNFKINYRNVGDAFRDAFEIRGITVSAYYRLLIPEIIPEYKTIFYFDVDIIFRNDLSEFYESCDLTGYYIGGVSTPYSDISDYIESVMNTRPDQYICSGTLLINSKLIREDQVIHQFKNAATKNWKYQDQDIINIVCKDKIKFLQPWFGVIGTISEIISDTRQIYYSKEEVEFAIQYGTIHYNGAKPWRQFCYNFDIWWEYYRRSVYFDSKFYFDFYHSKQSDLDTLTLSKRIKLLAKYFFKGRKKALYES